jgi:hypothetical protein
MEEDKGNFIDKLYPGNPGKSLYAIAIARETHEDTDYPKLKKDERDLVFNALRFILNQENQLYEIFKCKIEEKQKLLEVGLGIYNNLYGVFLRFIEVDDKSESSIDVLREYLGQKKDFECLFNDELFKENLSLCKNIAEFRVTIQEAIKTQEIAIAQIIKESTLNKAIYVLGENNLKVTKQGPCKFMIEKALVDFISTEKISKFFTKLSQDKFEISLKETLNITDNSELDHFYDLKAKAQDNSLYFKNEFEETNRFIKQFSKMKDSIANSNYLVVFNEMFFCKSSNNKLDLTNYAPFFHEEFKELSSQIADLSKIPNTIFHANFLHFEKNKITGKLYKQLVDFTKQELNKSQSIEIIKKSLAESFFDETSVYFSDVLEKVTDEKEYQVFKNMSSIYSQGEVLSSCQKLSYKDEANLLLPSVSLGEHALYLFGNGVDTAKSECNSKDLCEAINKYISTEICFDLKLGIRKKLTGYPPEGKIHIVVSNTLPFPLTDPSMEVKENFEHFPENIPLILHVDPHEQDLFVKNPSKQTFFLDKQQIKTTSHDIYKIAQPQNLALHDPLYSFQLGMCKNVFTFKIWNINAALDKL